MNTADKRNFCVILIGVYAVHIGLIYAAGAFRFAQHEADMAHLADMVLRIAAGGVPHIDFMTPIGDWAMRPMAILLARAGDFGIDIGLGRAMLWGQLAVAGLTLPAIWWTGASRMRFGVGVVFGIVTIGLICGLVWGGTAVNVSMSMHYNRWGWALAWLVAVLVVVPARSDRADVADGVVIGLAMAALVMIKVTFAAALAVPVFLGLLIQFRARVLWVAILVVLAVWGGVSAVFGIAIWDAYAQDLLAVIGSANRAEPSAPLNEVLLSPAYTAATLAGVGGALLLRRVARGAGLSLLLMIPAFIFIAYQNYGNDPLWLGAVAFCLLALMPGREDGPRAGIAGVVVVAGVLILPQMMNILYSPLRHLTQPKQVFRTMMPDPAHADLMMVGARAGSAYVSRPLPVKGFDEEVVTFAGRTFGDCTQDSGLVPVAEAEVAVLTELGLVPGMQPFVADLFSPQWLFGGLEPLPGGAPWYYDGLPGFAVAGHLLVPECAADPTARKRILGLITAQGVTVSEIHSDAIFTLYEIVR